MDDVPLKERVYLALKLLWFLAVVVFVAIYAIRHHEDMLQSLLSIPVPHILASIALYTLAKLLVTQHIRLSLSYSGVAQPFAHCLYMYNVTQMAKYVPGSIWHFVGRIAVYKDLGLSNSTIKDTLLLEHIVLLAAATVFGCGAILFTELELLVSIFNQLGPYFLVPLALFLVSCFIILTYRKKTREFLRMFKRSELNYRELVVQFCLWLTFGLGFAVTLLPFVDSYSVILYATGVFALAYVIGFIIPIAPAGIGIREAVIVVALSPHIDTQLGVLLSTLSRTTLVLLELALFAISLRFKR